MIGYEMTAAEHAAFYAQLKGSITSPTQIGNATFFGLLGRYEKDNSWDGSDFAAQAANEARDTAVNARLEAVALPLLLAA